MTGGVRGRLETVLSRCGERLQPPWLPHAMEGGVGRWGRGCDRPITCESSASSSRALLIAMHEHMLVSKVYSITYKVSVPPCVVGLSL